MNLQTKHFVTAFFVVIILFLTGCFFLGIFEKKEVAIVPNKKIHRENTSLIPLSGADKIMAKDSVSANPGPLSKKDLTNAEKTVVVEKQLSPLSLEEQETAKKIFGN